MANKLYTFALVSLILLMATELITPPAALACPPDGSGCKSCILGRMKNGCPECAPVLRCMARCLWGGSSRPNCEKRCDCGLPKLNDCKKCMSRCKCSCAA